MCEKQFDVTVASSKKKKNNAKLECKVVHDIGSPVQWPYHTSVRTLSELFSMLVM